MFLIAEVACIAVVFVKYRLSVWYLELGAIALIYSTYYFLRNANPAWSMEAIVTLWTICSIILFVIPFKDFPEAFKHGWDAFNYAVYLVVWGAVTLSLAWQSWFFTIILRCYRYVEDLSAGSKTY